MSNDAGFALAYAIIMLNTDQHNHNVRKQNIPMTVEVSPTAPHLLPAHRRRTVLLAVLLLTRFTSDSSISVPKKTPPKTAWSSHF